MHAFVYIYTGEAKDKQKAAFMVVDSRSFLSPLLSSFLKGGNADKIMEDNTTIGSSSPAHVLHLHNLEEGKLRTPDHQTPNKRSINWPLLLLYCGLAAVGTIGGPMMLRLYYLHGGNRKWLSSCLQTAGFPLLLLPLSVNYLRHRSRRIPFMAEPRLLAASAAIGLLMGLDNFLYSMGVSLLPVSTSSLLFSTQLAFNAFFARVIVKQRFTPYAINAVVLMTLGAVLLGVGKSGDRPPGVTNAQYFLGYVITLGAAALVGFLLPCVELSYAKAATKALTYNVVLQFQFCVTFFGTVFCTVGMLANKDFQAISREAAAFGLGEAKYYLVLVMSAVLFALLFVGTLGVVSCTSSLFTGILAATLLPMTEVAGVIFYHEKFTAEKGMALALCLWGFASYFYGSYRAEKESKAAVDSGRSSSNDESERK